jgi:hypothetical protein
MIQVDDNWMQLESSDPLELLPFMPVSFRRVFICVQCGVAVGVDWLPRHEAWHRVVRG